MRAPIVVLLAAAVAAARGQGASPEPEPDPEPEPPSNPPPPPPPPPPPCSSVIANTREGSTACTNNVGEQCSYSCAEGYSATGSQTSGSSGDVTCGADSTFSEGACSPLPCVEHPIQFTSSGTTQCRGVTGDLCDYSCAEGYRDSLSGLASGSLTCLATSSWSVGACVPKACADKTIQNTTGPAGVTICQGVTGSPPCAYTCAEGYTDQASRSAGGSVTCLASGAFSDGSCEGNVCTSVVIDHTSDGSTTCSGKRTTESCPYECAVGYTDSGAGTRTCGTDGLFSPGSCEPNECTPIQIAHTKEGVTHCTGVTGQDCSYSCADGYSGDGTVTCANTGAFTVGMCNPKACASLVVDHTTEPAGSTTCSGHTDDTCHFTCAEGFRATTGADGSMAVMCTANGNDEPQFPATQCAAEACAPMDVPNSDKTGNGICTGTTGQDCSFQCNPGYSIGGTGQPQDSLGRITCGTNRKFSEASCEPNTCRDLSISHTVPTPGNNCARVRFLLHFCGSVCVTTIFVAWSRYGHRAPAVGGGTILHRRSFALVPQDNPASMHAKLVSMTPDTAKLCVERMETSRLSAAGDKSATTNRSAIRLQARLSVKGTLRTCVVSHVLMATRIRFATLGVLQISRA